MPLKLPTPPAVLQGESRDEYYERVRHADYGWAMLKTIRMQNLHFIQLVLAPIMVLALAFQAIPASFFGQVVALGLLNCFVTMIVIFGPVYQDVEQRIYLVYRQLHTLDPPVRDQ